MWRHIQSMLKGDFSTYTALICPLCNGYQGLSGNGAIKKRCRERDREGRRDRRKTAARWRERDSEEEEKQTDNGEGSQRDHGNERKLRKMHKEEQKMSQKSQRRERC